MKENTKKEKGKKQAKSGKNLKFETKQRVREGTGKIWYLKYKISEDLEITLKKFNMTTLYP